MSNILTKKIPWKIGLPLAVILLSIWPLCSFFATRPLVNLEMLPISAMSVYPLRKQVPVRKIEWTGRDRRDTMLSIPIYDKIPHALYLRFLYNKARQDLIVLIIWIDPSGLFGQFNCYYEISSPDVKADLLKFIAEHEDDLQNYRLQRIMLGMLDRHEDELRKLGDGDPYVGLERAGVADWIKSGKDPEAEWRKKYP